MLIIISTHCMTTKLTSFRERLLRREPLLGTLIRTPSPHAVEILGGTGLDFVVIDGEHAPFDRTSIDLVLFAARAAGIPAVVRTPDATPGHLLNALDCGADGVLVPHVASVETARAIVEASRYQGGRRGFSHGGRAGQFGAFTVWDHIRAADARTTVLAMIEDPEAVEHLDAIGAVDGLDGFFLGRGDLSVSMRAESSDAPPVRALVERIASVARARNKPMLAYTSAIDAAEVAWLRSIGVTALAVSSEQGLLKRAAMETCAAFRKAWSA
jgi:2-keto-3-deoxy-L-rhamnonate aldolase RhmA